MRSGGIFSSRDGRFVFFFRGLAGLLPLSRLNLIGIDTHDDYRLFDLTGNEFGYGLIPDLAMENSIQHTWGPENMNCILAPKEGTDVLFFQAKYNDWTVYRSYQAFMLNLDFPLAALPVTSFDPQTQEGWIDNLVADQTANFIAFSRSDRVLDSPSIGAYEKIYVVDLAKGAYNRDLTELYPNHNRASIDGSFRFLPSPSPETPPELIFGSGKGGNDLFANNPPEARLWLYPLENVADPSAATVSYPLTERQTLLLFNVLPYDG